MSRGCERDSFLFPYKIYSIGIKIKEARGNIQIIYNIFYLNKYRSWEKRDSSCGGDDNDVKKEPKKKC